eukprot:Hpha_TRINITY_DN24212_c0_g1::TRINITY_DN24212_c0_g1_i1::g.36011::m.36011
MPDAEDAQTCNLCFEPPEIRGELMKFRGRAPVSVCDHFFCVDCIGEWLRRSSTCPVCRRKVSRLRAVKISDGSVVEQRKIEKRRFEDYDTDDTEDVFGDGDSDEGACLVCASRGDGLLACSFCARRQHRSCVSGRRRRGRFTGDFLCDDCWGSQRPEPQVVKRSRGASSAAPAAAAAAPAAPPPRPRAADPGAPPPPPPRHDGPGGTDYRRGSAARAYLLSEFATRAAARPDTPDPSVFQGKPLAEINEVLSKLDWPPEPLDRIRLASWLRCGAFAPPAAPTEAASVEAEREAGGGGEAGGAEEATEAE